MNDTTRDDGACLSGSGVQQGVMPAAWKPRKWAQCDTHGPEEQAAWGCPHCVAELRTENRRLLDALQRLADWGGLPGSDRYSGTIAEDAMRWFRDGMAGPLPPLPDWATERA